MDKRISDRELKDDIEPLESQRVPEGDDESSDTEGHGRISDRELKDDIEPLESQRAPEGDDEPSDT